MIGYNTVTAIFQSPSPNRTFYPKQHHMYVHCSSKWHVYSVRHPTYGIERLQLSCPLVFVNFTVRGNLVYVQVEFTPYVLYIEQGSCMTCVCVKVTAAAMWSCNINCVAIHNNYILPGTTGTATETNLIMPSGLLHVVMNCVL